MPLGPNTLKTIILGRRVRRSPSHWLICLQLSLDVISVMMPRAPPVVTPPSVLWPDWKTLARLAYRWSNPPNLNVCSAPSFLSRFCGATDKPKSAWFWGQILRNRRGDFETQITKMQLSILRPKSKNLKPLILRSNREKPSPPILRPNQRKTSSPVLRPNQRKLS
jgi:hypothetical protein